MSIIGCIVELVNVRSSNWLNSLGDKKMKKGDVVTIRDSSWSRCVKGGELSSGCHDRGGKHVVIEIDCTFPLGSSNVLYSKQPDSYRNNTVIQALDSKGVSFIHSGFLRLETHRIVIDGKTIELSNESFENLKQQLI